MYYNYYVAMHCYIYGFETMYSNLITYLVSGDKYVKLIRYAKVRYTLHLSLKSVFKARHKHWNSNHVFWKTEKNQNNKVKSWMNILRQLSVMKVFSKILFKSAKILLIQLYFLQETTQYSLATPFPTSTKIFNFKFQNDG